MQWNCEIAIRHWRGGGARRSFLAASASILGSVLVVGCHSFKPLTHEQLAAMTIETSHAGEFEIGNERLTSDTSRRPLTLREGFKQDAIDFWPTIGNDAKQIVNGKNAAILGLALGGSLVIREELDDDVRRDTAQHPQRWGDTSEFLGYLGSAEAQVPVLLAIHASSLMNDDEELHDLSTTMLSAYAINGLSSIAVKGIANTDRPSDRWNNGDYGFPSFHASSSVTMAAVLDEYYGPSVGLPAYALAGLIGWSRIDQRDHDLSDVVFGAAMGYVIGKTVAKHHLVDNSRVSFRPAIDPASGSVELLVEVPF
jgi:hypothetical protein